MRTRFLTTAAALVAAAVLIPAGTASAHHCAYADTMPLRTDPNAAARAQQAVICLTNHERTARGLRALAADPALNLAASRHSYDMATRNYFSHTSPEGQNVLHRIRKAGYCSTSCGYYAENIYWWSGAGSTPRRAVQWWMGSAGHRANILNPNYDEIGVGMTADAPTTYTGQAATYTQVFGSLG